MSLWHHPPMNHLHLVTLSWVRYCTCFKPDLLHNKQVQTGGTLLRLVVSFNV